MSIKLSRRSVLTAATAGTAALAGGWMWPRPASAAALVQAEGKPAATNPITYKFKIGSIEAIAISDSQLQIAPIHPIFAPEAKAEEVNKILVDNFKATDSVRPEVNVLVLRKGSDVVLIDTGTGKGGRLLAGLASAGIKPSDITLIAITHLHSDHFGGLTNEAGEFAFAGARVVTHKNEVEYWKTIPTWGDVAIPEEWKTGWKAGVGAALKAIEVKTDLVKGGDKPLPWLKFVETFGHTPGHCSLAISDGAERAFVFGDVGHHPVFTFQKPEWTVAFDYNRKDAVASRKKTLAMLAAERTRVLAYHMPWPGVGFVKARDGAYEWVAQDWAW